MAAERQLAATCPPAWNGIFHVTTRDRMHANDMQHAPSRDGTFSRLMARRAWGPRVPWVDVMMPGACPRTTHQLTRRSCAGQKQRCCCRRMGHVVGGTCCQLYTITAKEDALRFGCIALAALLLCHRRHTFHLDDVDDGDARIGLPAEQAPSQESVHGLFRAFYVSRVLVRSACRRRRRQPEGLLPAEVDTGSGIRPHCQ